MRSEQPPKPPPAPTLSRLAADSLVETIDGPGQIVKLVGKAMPVLTRLPDGSLGFRMMRQVREVAADSPLLLLTNSEGQRVRVGADHVFVREDGSEVAARDLGRAERLLPSWTYPAGYVLPEAPEYASGVRGRPWQRAVVIERVEPAGRGPVYGGSVNQTKLYFLTFGALCRAQG